MFGFTKSKRGLGELYEDDFRKKAFDQEPASYLVAANSPFSGTDSGLKIEIDSIMKNLYY